jgi:hypothetical protein
MPCPIRTEADGWKKSKFLHQPMKQRSSPFLFGPNTFPSIAHMPGISCHSIAAHVTVLAFTVSQLPHKVSPAAATKIGVLNVSARVASPSSPLDGPEYPLPSRRVSTFVPPGAMRIFLLAIRIMPRGHFFFDESL